MIRQKQLKHIGEVYGTKLEDTTKSHVIATHQCSGQKLGNSTDRAYGHTNSLANYKAQPAVATTISAPTKSLNYGRETARRKSARASNKIANGKYVKEPLGLKEDRRSPVSVTKEETVIYTAPLDMYDNKICGNNKEVIEEQHQHRRHHHKHNHQDQQKHHHSHDEDKDDDTDEFFDLIRHTVEAAIGKSISELLNRNFRELSSKVERFSAYLKNTNALLYQIQKELNNKISHYGEENSRHFRYLCMKSEYDKMFYQHQTMIAAASSKPMNDENYPPETLNAARRKNTSKASKSPTKMQHAKKGNSAAVECAYHTMKCKQQRVAENKEPRISSSGDISQKSSEVGIREVLDHIQKFYTHMHFNDLKVEQSSDGPGTSQQQRNVMRHEDTIIVNEDDEDIWEISSDDMTPRNEEINSHSNDDNTARGGMTQRGNNGAGDA